jgi:hypothetical protein
MAGAALYLLVERPYSLRRRPAAPAAPSPGMPTADPSSAVEEGK